MSIIEVRTGSDSDIKKLKDLYAFFDKLEIPYEPRILSAHRTPDIMTSKAKNLEKEGFYVSIAAAGGSAHLAGMTASETLIPVIALPVKSSLGNLDSLLSMLQMPPGVPNGTVGIEDTKNAGILATRIAYLDNEEVRRKLAIELKTKIVAGLENKPSVDIYTTCKPNLSLLQDFGINYRINSETPTSPVAIYFGNTGTIFEEIHKDREQISIISPYVDESFSLENASNLVIGPYAWTGIDRESNALIYCAQILGNFFPEVKEGFRQYRDDLRLTTIEKDRSLRELGIDAFL